MKPELLILLGLCLAGSAHADYLPFPFLRVAVSSNSEFLVRVDYRGNGADRRLGFRFEIDLENLKLERH